MLRRVRRRRSWRMAFLLERVLACLLACLLAPDGGINTSTFVLFLMASRESRHGKEVLHHYTESHGTRPCNLLTYLPTVGQYIVRPAGLPASQTLSDKLPRKLIDSPPPRHSDESQSVASCAVREASSRGYYYYYLVLRVLQPSPLSHCFLCRDFFVEVFETGWISDSAYCFFCFCFCCVGCSIQDSSERCTFRFIVVLL